MRQFILYFACASIFPVLVSCNSCFDNGDIPTVSFKNIEGVLAVGKEKGKYLIGGKITYEDVGFPTGNIHGTEILTIPSMLVDDDTFCECSLAPKTSKILFDTDVYIDGETITANFPLGFYVKIKSRKIDASTVHLTGVILISISEKKGNTVVNTYPISIDCKLEGSTTFFSQKIAKFAKGTGKSPLLQ